LTFVSKLKGSIIRDPMDTGRAFSIILIFIIILFQLAGCGTRAPKRERYAVPVSGVSPLPGEREIKLQATGYSIQVGAFAIMDNAVRLSAVLAGKGMDAYYLKDRDGLFRVRIGDFRKMEEARAKAEEFLSEGVIVDYYIVKPENSAAALARFNGMDYLRNELVATAERFLGVPYKWGGTSPDKGFDCSGFAMVVYQLNGLMLPRTSVEQYSVGTPVKTNYPAGGDLVFFDVSGGRKSLHVGIYTGNDKFIHAPSEGKKILYGSLSNPYFHKRYIGARTYL